MNLYKAAIILVLFLSCKKTVPLEIPNNISILLTDTEHKLKYYRIENKEKIWFFIIQDNFKLKLFDSYIKDVYFFDVYVEDINQDGIQDIFSVEFDNNTVYEYYISTKEFTFVKTNPINDKIFKLNNQPYYLTKDVKGFASDYTRTELICPTKEGSLDVLYSASICDYNSDSIEVFKNENGKLVPKFSFFRKGFYQITDEKELVYFWNYFIRHHFER